MFRTHHNTQQGSSSLGPHTRRCTRTPRRSRGPCRRSPAGTWRQCSRPLICLLGTARVRNPRRCSRENKRKDHQSKYRALSKHEGKPASSEDEMASRNRKGASSPHRSGMRGRRPAGKGSRTRAQSMRRRTAARCSRTPATLCGRHTRPGRSRRAPHSRAGTHAPCTRRQTQDLRLGPGPSLSRTSTGP